MESTNIVLSITPKVYAKIFAYAKECKWEVSGFGSFNKNGVIDTLFPLLTQKCSGSETEMDEKALEEITRSGFSKRINFHWHSHVNMGVFWSAQDKSNVENLIRFYPVLISVVVNKKGESLARLDYARPMRITHDKLPLEISVPFPPDQEMQRIRDEIEDKVSYSSGYVHPSGYQYSGGYRGSQRDFPFEGGNSDGLPFGERSGNGRGSSRTPQDLITIRRRGEVAKVPAWILQIHNKKTRREVMDLYLSGKIDHFITSKSSSSSPVITTYSREEAEDYVNSITDLTGD